MFSQCCWILGTDTHTETNRRPHAYTHIPTPTNTHVCRYTQLHSHTHMHTHTRKHTNTQNLCTLRKLAVNQPGAERQAVLILAAAFIVIRLRTARVIYFSPDCKRPLYRLMETLLQSVCGMSHYWIIHAIKPHPAHSSLPLVESMHALYRYPI